MASLRMVAKSPESQAIRTYMFTNCFGACCWSSVIEISKDLYKCELMCFLYIFICISFSQFFGYNNNILIVFGAWHKS